MIKLYGVGFSFNISKVRYCLNFLNLPYEWIQTNPIVGENKSPDFLNISTSGTPAILHRLDGLDLLTREVAKLVEMLHGTQRSVRGAVLLEVTGLDKLTAELARLNKNLEEVKK